MDHIREAHNVPGEIRKISLETLFPPWTVTRMVYTESLTSRRSGISNDVLLFSEVGLSLVHHYRVYKRGLPQAAFRGKYLAQLRAFLPLPTILPAAVDHGVAPLSVPADVDIDLEQVFGDVGYLSAMVTPVCEFDGIIVAQPLMVTSPAGETVVSPGFLQPSTGSVGCSSVPPESGGVHAGEEPVAQSC